jgi:hypothetical protein
MLRLIIPLILFVGGIMKFPHEMDSHAYIKKKKLFSYYPIVTSRKKSETSSLDNNVHLM